MSLSNEHKEALAQGRLEARAIKSYLGFLDARRTGRPVTRERLEKRLAKATTKLELEDDPLKRVQLMQSKLDIGEALAKTEVATNLEDLEAEFVKHVASYGERKGITYTAWREYGVPADVLRKAGIPETRRRT